jgi:predicted ATPase/transcriptional regulator with XRE-family HTH domain
MREPRDSFGDLLRRLRSAAALSQEELAERAGLSRHGISDLERGARHAPRLETVRMLADALALDENDRAALLAAARPTLLGNGAPVAAAASPVFLPAPLTRLIGRDTELAALSAGLQDADVRLLTVTGPGGVGKTRLALYVAAELQEAFPDGVHFVPLATIRDADLFLPAIAHVLGLSDMGRRPLAQRLVEFLRQRQLLLVLDNLEQLPNAPPLVADLLTACPQLTILATSQTVLHLSAEHDLPLSPLPFPSGNDAGSVTQIATVDAVRLFLDRAQAARPDFVLTERNAATVADICARLDGLPLAIELAAARVGHLPLPAILQRLEQRLAFLTGGAHDKPDRLRTLRNAMTWSYDLLHADEQRLFRGLSVFQGGITLDAVETLAREMGAAQGNVLDQVASLVDKSLVQLDETTDEPRYRMLETIREFGVEQLAVRDEAEAIRQAHATYFLALAERAAPAWWGPDPGVWLDRLETEHDNLRAALAWACDHGHVATAYRLAIALHWFWRLRGPVSEGRRWIETLLADDQGIAPALKAALLARAGDLAQVQGTYGQAGDLLDASIALARDLDDRATLTLAVCQRGITAQNAGDLDLSQHRLEQAVELARSTGASFWDSLGTAILASVLHQQGNTAQATALVEAAYATARASNSMWTTVLTLYLRGFFAAERGDLGGAEALYRESLMLMSAMGEHRFFASALAGFAWVLAAQGHPERGARLCGAVDAILDVTGVSLARTGRLSYDHARALVCDRMGEASFEEARVAGRVMPRATILEEIVSGSTPASQASGHRADDPAGRIGLTARERKVR